MASVSPPASGQIARLVAGHRGLEGVRRAVTDPFAYGLGPLLDHCLPNRSRRLAPMLLRSKYLPGRTLTAYYTLAAGNDHHAPRHLAVTWSVVPPDLDGVALLEREAEVRGLVEPFSRLVAATPDGCLTLLLAPMDPAFPRLVRLSEPGYVTSTAASLAGRRTTSERDVRTVRYRPGQRHVLRVTTTDPTGSGSPRDPVLGGRGSDAGAAIVKLHRDGAGTRPIAVATALDAALTAAVPGVRPARSIGYVEADQATWWAAEDGEPVWRRLSDLRAPGLLRRIGQALRVVHEAGPVPADAAWPDPLPSYPRIPPLPRYDAFAEMAATARAAEHIRGLLPQVGARIRDVISQLGDGLAARPAEPATLIHGELSCENVLVAGDELRLIGLDRASIAEPALDLGTFVADLWWWCASLGVDARPAVAAFVEGYGPCDRVRLARAHGLAVLFHLKLAGRRIPVHHPEWAHHVIRAVRLAEDAVVGGPR